MITSAFSLKLCKGKESKEKKESKLKLKETTRSCVFAAVFDVVIGVKHIQ